MTLTACGSSAPAAHPDGPTPTTTHSASTHARSTPRSPTPTKATATLSTKTRAATKTPATPSATATTPPVPPAAADRRATTTIAALAASRGPGGVSVAALDMTTGVSFVYGATHGMREGSIAKLDIIETLMLQHQKAGTHLSDNDVYLTRTMIENSNNDAADALYREIGGLDAITAANVSLGLRHTVIATGGYWGLSKTSAPDQRELLKNLVDADGPLTERSRHYILGLMRDVEADQRWGVGSVADRGNGFANKNGWLGVYEDNGRWLVNSLGVIRVHGDLVLMAVLTQHGPFFDNGVVLTEDIARAVVSALG